MRAGEHGPFLWSAESCDDADPAEGARLSRGDLRLGRLSPEEAVSLAADLLGAVSGRVVFRTDDGAVLESVVIVARQ